VFPFPGERRGQDNSMTGKRVCATNITFDIEKARYSRPRSASIREGQEARPSSLSSVYCTRVLFNFSK